MREYETKRKTKETDISIYLNLDGNGQCEVDTGIGFFDHMLTSFATHSGIDLKLHAVGDLYVDMHHTIEDTGIVLGDAFSHAIGDKKGIVRFASSYIPMDEALSFCAIDISGRPYLVLKGHEDLDKQIGDFESTMLEEFFRAFAFNFQIALHLEIKYGNNSHHQVEALFKSLAKAVKQAIKIESDKIPSTKGEL